MRCFKCARDIVELPEGDPGRESEDWHYTPAFVVEVIGGGPAGGGPCCCTVICWVCMHEIQPDMWMSGEGWDSMSPAVPFNKLPAINHEAENSWDAETYDDVEVPPPE